MPMMSNPVLPGLNDTNFYSVLQDTPGPTIVFFTSVGCSSCRYWKTLLERLLVQRPDLHIYEIDAQQSMGLTQEYEVYHLPALFLFLNGQYHATLQCEASLDVIAQTLDRLLAAPAQDAP